MVFRLQTKFVTGIGHRSVMNVIHIPQLANSHEPTFRKAADYLLGNFGSWRKFGAKEDMFRIRRPCFKRLFFMA